MNAQAIAVQHAAGRSIMSGFHALFSVGGLVGAALVALLLHAGLPLPMAALAIAIVLLGIGLKRRIHFLDDRGEPGTGTLTIVPKPHVLLLGALCFILSTYIGIA